MLSFYYTSLQIDCLKLLYKLLVVGILILHYSQISIIMQEVNTHQHRYHTEHCTSLGGGGAREREKGGEGEEKEGREREKVLKTMKMMLFFAAIVVLS